MAADRWLRVGVRVRSFVPLGDGFVGFVHFGEPGTNHHLLEQGERAWRFGSFRNGTRDKKIDPVVFHEICDTERWDEDGYGAMVVGQITIERVLLYSGEG